MSYTPPVKEVKGKHSLSLQISDHAYEVLTELSVSRDIRMTVIARHMIEYCTREWKPIQHNKEDLKDVTKKGA